jgi:hypothetical protein
MVNNNPSIADYEFRTDKKVSILYTKTSAGDWMPASKAFGFCDGKIVWMNVSGSFYPLIRNGNAFQLLVNYYAIKGKSKGPTVVIGDDYVSTIASSVAAT